MRADHLVALVRRQLRKGWLLPVEEEELERLREERDSLSPFVLRRFHFLFLSRFLAARRSKISSESNFFTVKAELVLWSFTSRSASRA